MPHLHGPMRVTQRLDMLYQQSAPSIRQIDGKEIGRACDLVAAVVGHGEDIDELIDGVMGIALLHPSYAFLGEIL
jgi:hypothetical protein